MNHLECRGDFTFLNEFHSLASRQYQNGMQTKFAQRDDAQLNLIIICLFATLAPQAHIMEYKIFNLQQEINAFVSFVCRIDRVDLCFIYQRELCLR